MNTIILIFVFIITSMNFPAKPTHPLPPTCLATIHVGLSDDCESQITLDMVLRSLVDIECMWLEIKDNKGKIIADNILTGEHAGQTLIYTVINRCEGGSCWGHIVVEDKDPPVIEVEDLTIYCGEDSSPDALGGFNISDCSDFTYTISDVFAGTLCSQDKQILRIIKAKDIFGNTAVDTQIITVLPIPFHMILPPTSSLKVSCGVIDPDQILEATGEVTDAYPTFNGVPIHLHDACNLVYKYEDHVIEICGEGCGESVKITRTWFIYDWCNLVTRPLRFEQIISAKDTLGPVIHAPDHGKIILYTDPWSCTADHTFTPPGAEDDCTPEALIKFRLLTPPGTSFTGHTAYEIPMGHHTFGWQAIDCCENYSEPVYFHVEIRDTVSPVAISKEKIVIALSYDHVEQTGKAKLFAKDVDNNSFDQCGPVTLKVRRDKDACKDGSDEYGDYVTFCCKDINDFHKVYLLVTDESGNTNLVWSEVLVEAKDVVIECTDVLVECHEDIENAIAKNIPRAYFQICQIDLEVIEISRDYTKYDPICNRGYIEVVYGIKDYPTFRCTSTVYVQYKGEFTCSSINWPDEHLITTDCKDIPSTDLTWEFGACELIGWTLESDTFYFATDACAKIINTYTVIDWCIYDAYRKTLGEEESVYALQCNNDFNAEVSSVSGIYVFTEIIKLIDTIPPELLVCENPRFPIRDQCSRSVVLQNFTDDRTDCPNLIIRYELTVITDEGQTFVYNTTKKPGEIASISLTGPDGSPLQFKGNTSHTAIWKVWDGCGNVNSCTITFFIIDDKAPTPYCISVSSALMNDGTVELWAKDFDKGSFDNCENSMLRYTFNQIPPDTAHIHQIHYFDENGRISNNTTAEALYRQGKAQIWLPELNTSGKIFTCKDFAMNPVMVKISVFDSAFNTDFCLVELNLADNTDACAEEETAMIAGKIYTEYKEFIPNAMVNLEKIDVGFLNATPTDINGQYAFAGNTISGNYSLHVDKEDDYLNGVSTLDILHIQRHILGVTSFTSPYKMIAADVNNDKAITVQDITFLQRLILGLRNDLPAGAWKFVNASQELFIENVLHEYSEVRNLIGLNQDMMAEDFIGIKIGDVSGNVSMNLNQRGSFHTRSASVHMVTEDLFVPAGSLAEITFEINKEELYGFQMYLKTKGLVISHVQFHDTKDSDILTRYTDEGIMISFAKGKEPILHNNVLTVLVKVYETGYLSEMIELSKEIEPEVYTGINMQSNMLELSFITPITDGDGIFKVFQNQPNPFENETIISFYLPDEGSVGLQIFDIHGRLIHQNQSSYPRGYNQYLVNRRDMHLPAGMYFYNLSYKGKYISMKMLISQ
ncbi:MAG TPA: T9SS type A sorting domain-containing protein [Saprospiraceae bacterium]|nr:T9SS type A sorting domain-containing protein [Saprospiraceae bacterium]